MNCQQAIQAYLGSIKAEMVCRPGPGDRLTIVTPHLYPDHDCIVIYLREILDQIAVSDLGETARKLDTAGVDIVGSPARRRDVERILSGLGLTFHGGVISRQAQPSQLGDVLFRVISGCQAVGDLLLTAKQMEPSVFDDEFRGFLDENRFRYEANSEVEGATGRRYRVSFSVSGNHAANSLVATLSPTPAALRARVNGVFTMWSDVNGERRKISVINDAEVEVPAGDISLLGGVSRIFKWSDRKKLVSMLSEPLA